MCSCKTDYIILTKQCVYFYIRLHAIHSRKTCKTRGVPPGHHVFHPYFQKPSACVLSLLNTGKILLMNLIVLHVDHKILSFIKLKYPLLYSQSSPLYYILLQSYSVDMFDLCSSNGHFDISMLFVLCKYKFHTHQNPCRLFTF